MNINLSSSLNTKKARFFAFVLIIPITLVIAHFPDAFAQSSVKSDNYQITWPNLNMGAGIPSSTSYKVGLTGGQTTPGLYSSTGYKVRAGFWYIKSIIPFSFTISSTTINFGTLTAGSPVSKTQTLTVSAGGGGGYRVTAQENSPPTAAAGVTIPDTTCDNGLCSETTAGAWILNTTYGFGYNMSGDDIPSEFANATYYKQFADRNNSESPQVVMSNVNIGASRQATVTYKVNISATQAAGSYENIISFVATPAY